MKKSKSKPKNARKINAQTNENQYTDILLSQIDEPKYAVRGNIEEEALRDLAQSIDKIGLLNPITVAKNGNRYEIIAGHRRYLAHRKNKSSHIACRIVNANQTRANLIKMHENLVREQINIIDEARFLSQIIKETKCTQKELAKQIQKSEAYITERLQILTYPEIMENALRDGKITFSVARELNQIRNPQIRERYIENAIEGGINNTVAAEWKRTANSFHVEDNNNTNEEQTNGGTFQYKLPKYECEICAENYEIQHLRNIRTCVQCAEQIKQ